MKFKHTGFRNVFIILHILVACLVCAQNPRQVKIDSFIQLIETTDNPSMKPQYLNAIAQLYLELDPKKGIEYSEQAISTAIVLKDSNELAIAYSNLASNFGMVAELDKSLSNFEIAKSYYQALANKKGLADVFSNMGMILYMKGNFADALENLFTALPIYEEIDNKLGRLNSYTAVGNIYMQLKDYNKALDYDSLGLKLAEELMNETSIALISGNIANIYSNSGDTTRAIRGLQKAIAIYAKQENKFGLGRNLLNLAIIYQQQKDFNNSTQIFHKSLECFQLVNYSEGIGYAAGNLGKSYFLSVKYWNKPDSIKSLPQTTRLEAINNAEKYLKAGIRVFQEIQNQEILNQFYKTIAEFYQTQNDFKNALHYLKLHHLAKDSIAHSESKIKIEKLTTERELALKNKQIEIDKLAVEKKRNERAYFIIGLVLLSIASIFIYRNYSNQKQSNLLLSALNLQIQSSNKELDQKNQHLFLTLNELKETQDQLIQSEKQKENAVLRSKISQDIHDDISSGLTKISWLAESLKLKSSGMIPELSVVDKINTYSREAVLKLGEIIWSTNPERDNLPSLLSYMRTFINRFLEDSEIKCTITFPDPIPDVALNPELRRNLFLVFKEATHNCFKYSKASELQVNFSLDGDTFTMQLTDNGIGFQHGELQGSGNGLRNMEKRMQNVGASFQLDSISGKGTSLKFEGRIFS
ncbi:MAG: tetratricopeptide repeat protein [Saprospiraceae bacterium]|nr:tetratricopeptide repeat protein [Saprospiraceae bacterium]